MKVLIVDDDVELVGLLRFALDGAGYETVAAFDGRQALAVFAASAPDLVLLDVNLLGMDGFEVLAALRERGEVPVMMLTVRAGEQDEVRGLDLGADDYLRKPFSPRTLLARVRALLRRGAESEEPPRLAAAGPLALDVERCEARIGAGTPFRLSPLESRLLRALLNQRGRPVDPERLIAGIWSDRDAADRDALKQLIHRLRRKLHRAGGSADWIEYVPNAGYCIAIREPE